MAATSNLGVAKQTLRVRMRSVAPTLSVADRESIGRNLATRFLEDPVVARAARVALFAADESEPPTRPLFEALAARGVCCLLPRVRGRALEFAEVSCWEDLRKGRFGILAPSDDAPVFGLRPDDIVLVPAVAFDSSGNRLGRGGGYYDRAFPEEPSGPRLIGAAFGWQIVAAVPHDSHDRAMDAIVTADGLRWVSRGS